MSQPLVIDGHSTTVTITHHALQRTTQNDDGSTTIQIDSNPGFPFRKLVVKDDDGKVLFTAPDGPNNMWHAAIE